eukprot:Sdes_comp18701_c0_seq1m9002
MACRDCVFCKIVAGEFPSKVVFKNKEYAIFKDIRPASEHHFLVVPIEHVENGKSLLLEEKLKAAEMVEQLEIQGIEFLKKTVEEKGEIFAAQQSRVGFHWPPFNSIQHLHLHVIYPVSSMKFISNHLIFRENSWWFRSCERVKRYLSSREIQSES